MWRFAGFHGDTARRLRQHEAQETQKNAQLHRVFEVVHRGDDKSRPAFIEEGHRPRQKAVQPRSHIPPVQRLYLQARLTQTTSILVFLPSLRVHESFNPKTSGRIITPTLEHKP